MSKSNILKATVVARSKTRSRPVVSHPHFLMVLIKVAPACCRFNYIPKTKEGKAPIVVFGDIREDDKVGLMVPVKRSRAEGDPAADRDTWRPAEIIEIGLVEGRDWPWSAPRQRGDGALGGWE